MNRETRRANLRKLQLPATSTDTGHLRRTRSATTPSISNYFATPQKAERQKACSQVESISNKNAKSKIAQEKINKNEAETASGNEPSATNETAKAKRLKRTKLAGFLNKEKSEVLPFNRARSVDDFVTPAKKIKKAPRLKKAAGSRTTRSRLNRQPSIQSAFLRNEQMFAEITAQHCIADDVSPDDMQMALAISQSEVTMHNERKSRADEDVVVDLLTVGDSPAKEHRVQESVRSKLQKYGFQTAARENYNNLAALFQPVTAQRRSKCKWASKFTTLTLRNQEIQGQRLKQRIEDFLRQQCKTRTLSASEASPCPYFLLSSTLKKFEVSKHKQIIKPIVTCEPDDAARAEAIAGLECFFVTELFEVTHVRAGHLLKKWERIPGRDLSPQARSEESEVIESRLQRVYEKLEETFPKAARRLSVGIASSIRNETSNAEIVESVKIKAQINNHTLSTGSCDRNPTEKSDLDHIIELIKDYNEEKCALRTDSLAGPTHAEPEETPDKKRKLDQLNNNEYTSANHSFIKNAKAFNLHCSGRVSPDLFGDSDLDVEKENSACDISFDRENSTFEESGNSMDFKSERLTKTLVANPVIDLTQEDVEDGIVNSSYSVSKTEFNDPAKGGGASTQMFYENSNIIDSHNVRSPPKTLDTLPRIRSKSNLLKFVTHIPRERKNKFAEIDLVSLSDEEEDAGSTDHTALPLHEFSSQDKVNCSSTRSLDANSLNSPVQTAHEFSFVDLIEDDEPNPFAVTDSSVSVDVDVEPVLSQCFATPHKCGQCGQSDAKLAESLINWSRERAEFGILDSHSEPFTQSPYSSPRTPTRTIAVNDLAFSQPPSPESTTPMKNSRNSQKFAELLKAIGKDPIDSTAAQNAAYNMFDDDRPKLIPTLDEPRQPVALISLDDSYDDIDKLIYGTPKRKPSVGGPKEPAGLEQLLTAELRFQQDRTPIKLQTPYRCSQETVPTAATLDFTEQLEINGQIYNVRLATTPKPDFTKQTESELQRQLYKYGIKLLPRNKAVKLLEHIYNQTHPTIVLEDNSLRGQLYTNSS